MKMKAPRVPRPQADRPQFKYETPPGWRDLGAVKLSALTFSIGEGKKSAQFTLTPLAGEGGDLAENVLRWAKQVNVPKTELGDQLKKIQDIKIGERMGKYVDLIGPDKNRPEGNRILAAILPRGDVTWFFKLMGPEDLVGDQKRAFETFLEKFAFAE
jgi:hypothetical protein